MGGRRRERWRERGRMGARGEEGKREGSEVGGGHSEGRGEGLVSSCWWLGRERQKLDCVRVCRYVCMCVCV